MLNVTPDGSYISAPYSPTTNPQVTVTYDLALSGGLQAGMKYTFSWKVLRGLMPDDFVSAELDVTGTSGTGVTVSEGNTFTFGDDSSGADLTVDQSGDFSGTLTITMGSSSYDLNQTIAAAASGNLNGFVEFYNGSDGLSFSASSDGSNAADTVSVPFVLAKPYAFKNNQSWTTTLNGTDGFTAQSSSDQTNPVWNLFSGASSDGYNALWATANEIYANTGGNPWYKTDAFLSMINTNASYLSNEVANPDLSFTLFYTGFMLDGMPEPYGSDNLAQTPLSYIWNEYHLPGQNTQGAFVTLVNVLNESLSSGVSFNLDDNEAYAKDSGVVKKFSIVSSGASPPAALRADWPVDPTFANNMDGTDPIKAGGNIVTYCGSPVISVYDDPTILPAVVNVSIPSGTYESGEYVPITITFNEPVCAGSDDNYGALTINGTIYYWTKPYAAWSRSSKKIHNCPIIIAQSLTGIVHFLEISWIDRKI
ncbi:MAG: hypothetical protein FWF44_01935, partial [Defluviitaleaceae bacterium]|nr:hypothetical protein [Defluviitaleaceae bacterium]